MFMSLIGLLASRSIWLSNLGWYTKYKEYIERFSGAKRLFINCLYISLVTFATYNVCTSDYVYVIIFIVIAIILVALWTFFNYFNGIKIIKDFFSKFNYKYWLLDKFLFINSLNSSFIILNYLLQVSSTWFGDEYINFTLLLKMFSDYYMYSIIFSPNSSILSLSSFEEYSQDFVTR